MKKQVVILFISLFVIYGCAPVAHAIYDISLTEVERPSDAKERYGEQKIAQLEEEGKNKYSFEDEMIKAIWLPTSSQFYFSITNKTNHSIKIIWDETVYVDESGMSKRVMHAGIKYTDRNNPQPPTTIVRGATVSDIVLPSDNVYFSPSIGWLELPLFPNSSRKSAQELKTKAKKYVGKSVQILLPLKIEDVVNEYIFSFKINNFKLTK